MSGHTAFVVSLLVIMAGLWAVGFVNGLLLARNTFRWRRELDRRGELPFRWFTLSYAEAWDVWRRLMRPPSTELESRMRVQLLRFAQAWGAFMGIGLLATLVRYV